MAAPPRRTRSHRTAGPRLSLGHGAHRLGQPAPSPDFNIQMIRAIKGQTGRWTLRKNWDKMTAVKRAASERLHQFAAETGQKRAGTASLARGDCRGSATTEKLYQLDYTFMCPTAYNMLHSMRNRWSLSRFRWTAER